MMSGNSLRIGCLTVLTTAVITAASTVAYGATFTILKARRSPWSRILLVRMLLD
jgi:hypothetical protein